MSTWKSFEEIEAWQMARTFCDEIYKIIQRDGISTDFALKNQINSSSGSIMDNIAEGSERDGNKEFINFLSIAKASAGESRSQLYRIYDRKYISMEEFESLKQNALNISGKIGNLMKYLKSSSYKGVKYK
jgi:four helix bundle protein